MTIKTAKKRKPMTQAKAAKRGKAFVMGFFRYLLSGKTVRISSAVITLVMPSSTCRELRFFFYTFEDLASDHRMLLDLFIFFRTQLSGAVYDVVGHAYLAYVVKQTHHVYIILRGRRVARARGDHF